jgi:N-methylhydantoinase B
MDRFKLRPYGRKGGAAGSLGETILDPGTPREESIGKIDILKLSAGQTVRITSPAGAGYGDPLARTPERVIKDILDGLVSAAEARDVYGVVPQDGGCDDAGTGALRQRLARPREETVEYVYGPERLAYEKSFPPALQDIAARLLAERPAAVRQYARGRLYQAIESNPALAGFPLSLLEAELRRLIDGIFTASPAELVEAAQ